MTTLKYFTSFVAFILIFTPVAAPTNWNSNLAPFSPFAKPFGLDEVIRTNGLECQLAVSSDRVFVYVYNYTTNDIGFLRLPATNVCKITLHDSNGHQLNTTEIGNQYGQALSQDQVDRWRHNWTNRHQSVFIRLIPNGIPKYKDAPTEICSFKPSEAFKIKKAGIYVLHLQLRLIEIGLDSDGKFRYPTTWLPPVTIKVELPQTDFLQK